MTQLTPTKTHEKLQTNLPFFAKHALCIKNKETGKVEPFILNDAQGFLHNKIEDQLKRKGRVRVIILKGRQQGMSTYVAARFYHKCTRNKGKAVFILSHEFQTTGKLFAMVDRFQQNIPDALKVHTGTYNSRQIKFDHIDSEYTTGTAGNEDVGRGGTLQYFHGSEVAFWENTDGIETGIMQSIADVDDTEIILESTANGTGNMFHRKCMAAMRGEGDFELIFIPWYWQKEYRREAPQNFVLAEDEVMLRENFKLDNNQIYWRRIKIEEFGSLWKFRQEYPMTVQDAFVSSGSSLVKPDSVIKARKTTLSDPSAPLVLGVDVGREHDRVVIMMRRGRALLPYIVYDPKKEGLIRQTTVCGRIINIVESRRVAKVFIDIAKGYGVIDNLVELGYGDIVKGVYFSEGAIESDKFLNKRAEMHIAARDWLETEMVSIPDSDELEVEFTSIPEYTETTRGLIQIPPKKEIKKMLGRSPDLWDAFILTFAYTVGRTLIEGQTRIKKAPRRSGFKTLQRVNRKTEQVTRTGLSWFI